MAQMEMVKSSQFYKRKLLPLRPPVTPSPARDSHPFPPASSITTVTTNLNFGDSNCNTSIPQPNANASTAKDLSILSGCMKNYFNKITNKGYLDNSREASDGDDKMSTASTQSVCLVIKGQRFPLPVVSIGEYENILKKHKINLPPVEPERENGNSSSSEQESTSDADTVTDTTLKLKLEDYTKSVALLHNDKVFSLNTTVQQYLDTLEKFKIVPTFVGRESRFESRAPRA